MRTGCCPKPSGDALGSRSQSPLKGSEAPSRRSGRGRGPKMTTVSIQRAPREPFVFIDRVVRRYVHLRSLSEYEIALLRGLSTRRESHSAGTELCNDGGRPSAPRIIVDGWAGRIRILPDGRRQIFTFLLPGDGMGICTRP